MRDPSSAVLLAFTALASAACGFPAPEGVEVDPELVDLDLQEDWFEISGELHYLPFEIIDGERVIAGDILDSRSTVALEELPDDTWGEPATVAWDAVASAHIETLEQSVFGRHAGGLWPGRIIRYKFEGGVKDKGGIRKAMRRWQGSTGVVFQQLTGAGAHVRIKQQKPHSGGRCKADAHVGYYAGRATRMRVSEGCTQGDYLHELGHVIGLHHEHQRPDRDRYIKVKTSNIRGCSKSNFRKLGAGKGRTLGSYDKKSIMHYPSLACAKSADKPTITTRGGGRIGVNKKLSSKDRAKTRLLYMSAPAQ